MNKNKLLDPITLGEILREDFMEPQPWQIGKPASPCQLMSMALGEFTNCQT